MNTSFQEKSLWVMLVGLVAAFSFYFINVLPEHSATVQPHQVILFVLAVVFLVLIQIVGHILAGVADRHNDTEEDERDRLIALKGMRNSGYVLAVGVFTTLVVALIAKGNFVVIHVLLAFWVLAQLVEIVSRLILYRRGV